MWLIVALLCLFVLGCSSTSTLEEVPVTAADMPMRFSAPGLEDASVSDRGGADRRAGATFRQRVYEGKEAFAVVSYMRVDTSQMGFEEKSDTAYIATMLNEDWKAELGEARRVTIAGDPVHLQTFRVPDKNASCVGMKRFRDRLVDDMAVRNLWRYQVQAVYCRGQHEPISLAEAQTIATGLSFQ
jgi:hypothetical protein